MAEGDYQRLAAACHCGEPVKLWSGRGRRPSYCDSHTGPPKDRPAAKREMQCPGCRGIFISATAWQTYCTKTCKARHRRGYKPRDQKRAHSCAHCGSSFESAYFAPMYCSKRCKAKAWEITAPKRPKNKQPPKLKLLCAYYACNCAKCGEAHGSRSKWSACPSCTRAERKAAARAASTALAFAKHKAAGRTTACDECAAVFCPLYGSSNATLCSVCAEVRERTQRRVQKAKRRAVERGAQADRVDPFKVFERDGWRCQLCKVKTPRKKRGTYDDDAPELDHIVPLAKGGAHTYANTQCACRRCNGLKADRVLGQALLFG